MGRKSRKKFKEFDPKEIEEELEEDPDLLSTKKLEEEYEELDKILDTRQKMLDYQHNTTIPLCEFLTTDLMINFVNWLQSENII